MAELVDALVSNTSGFTSMPVRSRLWVQGRRAGLKHQWIHFHAGSIPALGTKNPDNRLIIGIFYLHRDTKKYAILSFPLPKQDKYTIFEKE